MQLKRTLLTAGVKGSVWLGSLFIITLGILLKPNLAEAEPFAYVANRGLHTVSVVDLATNTEADPQASVGTSPYDLAITPDGKFAYVTNSDDNNVSVVNTTDGSLAATVDVGFFPVGVAVTPDGAYVYVTNLSDNTVSVISTFNNTVVDTVDVGYYPNGVAVTPDGAYAYVTDGYSNSVSVIYTATNTVVATIYVGMNPYGIAISPNGQRAYVTNHDDDNVSVIDTATNTVVGGPISVGFLPIDVAVSPDGAFVYVTNFGGNYVSVLDTATNTVLSSITVGDYPYGVAISPDGKHAYVANSGSNTVSVIDTGTHTAATQAIAVGTTPYGIALSPLPKAAPPASEPETETAPEPKTDTVPEPEQDSGPPPLMKFADFDIKKAWVRLRKRAGRDGFVVKGHLESSSDGDGFDLSSEKVTVTFGDFSETISGGSMVRHDSVKDAEEKKSWRFFFRRHRHKGGYSFLGKHGGLIKVLIRDDGRFKVKAWGLDLGAIDGDNGVPFSLQVGDDLGQAEIPFRMSRKGRRGWFYKRK